MMHWKQKSMCRFVHQWNDDEQIINESCNKIFKKPKNFNILIFLTSILNKFTFTFTDCDINKTKQQIK